MAEQAIKLLEDYLKPTPRPAHSWLALTLFDPACGKRCHWPISGSETMNTGEVTGRARGTTGSAPRILPAAEASDEPPPIVIQVARHTSFRWMGIPFFPHPPSACSFSSSSFRAFHSMAFLSRKFHSFWLAANATASTPGFPGS